MNPIITNSWTALGGTSIIWIAVLVKDRKSRKQQEDSRPFLTVTKWVSHHTLVKLMHDTTYFSSKLQPVLVCNRMSGNCFERGYLFRVSEATCVRQMMSSCSRHFEFQSWERAERPYACREQFAYHTEWGHRHSNQMAASTQECTLQNHHKVHASMISDTIFQSMSMICSMMLFKCTHHHLRARTTAPGQYCKTWFHFPIVIDVQRPEGSLALEIPDHKAGDRTLWF